MNDARLTRPKYSANRRLNLGFSFFLNLGPVYFGRENDIFNAKRERERERERDNKNGGYFDGLLLGVFREREQPTRGGGKGTRNCALCSFPRVARAEMY